MPIIFTTSSANVNQAIRLVKSGAADVLQKPYDISALIALLREIIGGRPSLKDNGVRPDPTMISSAMLELKTRLERLAANTVGVIKAASVGPLKALAFLG